MSIRFSEITISDQQGTIVQFLLDGHPDEDGVRNHADVLRVVNPVDSAIQVSVQQYCFMTSSNEEDADCNHFSLIYAYDQLANLCNTRNPFRRVGTFINRDDVEHGKYFTFAWEVEAPC